MKPSRSLLAGCGVAVLGTVTLFSLLPLLSGCAGSHPGQEAVEPATGSAEGGASSPAAILPPPERPGKNGFLSNLGLLESLTRQAAREAVDSLPLPPGTPVTVVSTNWHEANWFAGNLVAEALASKGHEVKVVELVSKPPDAGNAGGQNQGAQQQQNGGGPDAGNNQNQSGPGSVARRNRAAADSAAAAAKADSTKNAAASSNSQASSPSPAGGAPGGAAAAAPAPVKPVELPSGEVLDVRVLEFGVGYADVSRSWLFGPVKFTRIGGVYLQVSHLVGPSGDLQKVVTAERHQVDHLSGEQRALAEGASYPFTPPDLKMPSLNRYIEPTVVIAIVASLVVLFQKNQN